MLKVFVSQPLADKCYDKIRSEFFRAKGIIIDKFNDDVELIDPFFYEKAPKDAKPLWFLVKSIQLISTADIVCFIGDWRNSLRCKMEHYVARNYDIKIVEE